MSWYPGKFTRGLPIIGSGPIANAPAAGAGNNNALWVDGSSIYQCVGVFNNAGTDFVNCGRPANLISLLVPTVASTVCAVVLPSNYSQTGQLYALSGGSGAIVSQTYVQTGSFGYSCGGASVSVIPVSTVGFKSVRSSNTGSAHFITVDGSPSSMVANGADTYSGSLFIGGRTDGESVNFEGRIASVSFYSGFNADGSCTGLQLIDRYDFNKWDGSANGTSLMGNPYTVTDGTPLTAKSYAWVNRALLA